MAGHWVDVSPKMYIDKNTESAVPMVYVNGEWRPITAVKIWKAGNTQGSSSPLYLLKDGMEQTGYTFTATAMAYRSVTGDTRNAPNIVANTGYITAGYNYHGSNNWGGLYTATIDKAVLAGFSAMNFKIKRRIYNVDERITLGTFNLTDVTASSRIINCLLDVSEQSTVIQDTDTVTITVPITSVYSSVDTVGIGIALRSKSGARAVSTDLYDIWLS